MSYKGQIALPEGEVNETAHAVVAEYLCTELDRLAQEMKRVAILLDAAGYRNKYSEMDEAADMVIEWSDGIKSNVQENLPFHDLDRLHVLMHSHKMAALNQAAKNAVDVIEDMYSMEIAEPESWRVIREALGLPAKKGEK